MAEGKKPKTEKTIIEYAYETMKRIRNEAVALLEGFPPSETVDALISILDYTIEREK